MCLIAVACSRFGWGGHAKLENAEWNLFKELIEAALLYVHGRRVN
jgi:hypothetical protein